MPSLVEPPHSTKPSKAGTRTDAKARIATLTRACTSIWTESRLGQVFLNLIVNATQAIPEGHFEENEVRLEKGTDAVLHDQTYRSGYGPRLVDLSPNSNLLLRHH